MVWGKGRGEFKASRQLDPCQKIELTGRLARETLRYGLVLGPGASSSLCFQEPAKATGTIRPPHSGLASNQVVGSLAPKSTSCVHIEVGARPLYGVDQND